MRHQFIIAEESYGNDEGLGKWNANMYPGKVSLGITIIFVYMLLFLTHLLKYLYVDQLIYDHCGLLVYESQCRRYFLLRHGHEFQDGHIVDTLYLTIFIGLNRIQC